ncbi:protein SSUH2 homolog [Paralichthys olivaceus]|uniref:protein SSUH2 homolog n=1 Tax=Paralichthys olivaceus TaxID=8255 RepID=UPI00097D905B|nr:PREDICTED: protein SSUH2 homolog [Paralichthys olivaceus]XP_019952040.1 PREDICTED: protein SSUH2 homolog [Paralichthys olivaceus]
MNSAAMYPPLNAPQANMFSNVPGYEGTVAGGGGYVPPPMPLQPVAPPQPGPVPDNWCIPSLDENVAREAFKNFASSNCCYSDGPAKDGVITSMEPLNTFRYRLETFTESRSTEWAHKPHEGEPADFYTQTAPQPWEVPAVAPSLFTDHKQEIRVPYTSSIKDCHDCHCSGTMPCEECQGKGHKVCWACNGNGETCATCNNTGQKSCGECDGRGTKNCTTCNGKRQLLTFIELKVEWTNHVEDHLVEQSGGLKVDDLRSVSGKELFKNNQYLLYPLLGFPNPAIAEASDRLIKDHQSKYSQNSRILQQRQTVELIPITKVNYKWEDDSHIYFVYGNENQVSADNYPATCCCVIL